MAEMDYVELSKVEKSWAPCEYAWECVKCPFVVRFLDGFIDPDKGSALLDRCRERNRVELFRAIGAVAYGQKRVVELCEVITLREPPEDAGVTASTGPS
jgi:hypothetical protein